MSESRHIKYRTPFLFTILPLNQELLRVWPSWGCVWSCELVFVCMCTWKDCYSGHAISMFSHVFLYLPSDVYAIWPKKFRHRGIFFIKSVSSTFVLSTHTHTSHTDGSYKYYIYYILYGHTQMPHIYISYTHTHTLSLSIYIYILQA